MIGEAVRQALGAIVPQENLHYDEQMSDHTTFRVGGPADCLVEIENPTQLQKITKYLTAIGLPYVLIGNGSNLLVGDRGFRGVVLEVCEKMSRIQVEGCVIRAQAGALLSQIARAALEHGLTGFEFAAGIPGTVGGAVVMNAGAYDGEMKQVVKSVSTLGAECEELLLSNEDMEFGYRTSAIKNRPYTVTEVVIELAPGDGELIKARMNELAVRRREKQPLEYPSAGSTFKRPEGHFAGALIMNAGLRGFQIGGARVSDKHCGFVVNMGGATAADIVQVMETVKKAVYEQFGVELEPEVISIGEF